VRTLLLWALARNRPSEIERYLADGVSKSESSEPKVLVNFLKIPIIRIIGSFGAHQFCFYACSILDAGCSGHVRLVRLEEIA